MSISEEENLAETEEEKESGILDEEENVERPSQKKTKASSSKKQSAHRHHKSSKHSKPHSKKTSSKESGSASVSPLDTMAVEQKVSSSKLEPKTPKGSKASGVIGVREARKVDEALTSWAGEAAQKKKVVDPDLTKPFPGIHLQRVESKEEVIEHRLASWFGENWGEADKREAAKAERKRAQSHIPVKPFPGIAYHDEVTQPTSPGRKNSL
mmetsp:Transcript_39309/g.99071  ORF Transcript_39309/g.99071 Transcript_39309/m.99071 type:complete len:211 (-) Transcript_39309:171-803(-)|eukprot:CAMPEP_0177652358 /NCGR_PEP_ID=MMETSP0447-20121125/13078_1 /TAXON_ID=0 /ORGANISM="Stygamoeba regulata, Strain BSH-02190019" /LENGTH=210 /DNA_ID=CAMNT_0019155579 /DNA_START=69 /DNA_END=701 /DNA_ORIENTATION=-